MTISMTDESGLDVKTEHYDKFGEEVLSAAINLLIDLKG